MQLAALRAPYVVDLSLGELAAPADLNEPDPPKRRLR